MKTCGTLPRASPYRAQGYEIIIITNQYPIGEGQITQEFYDSFMKKLFSMLREGGVEVKDVFFCPHRRDAGIAAACHLPFYGVNRDEGTRIASLGDLVRLI